MDNSKWEKIIKLLMLTSSDSDGEALSAIRMANEILKQQKQTWLDVMDLPQSKRERFYEKPEADWVMPFGKHKGSSLRDIAEFDLSYLQWLHESEILKTKQGIEVLRDIIEHIY